MAAIHLVELKGNVWKVPDTPGEWESAYWKVGEATAAKLIGGDLYLHTAHAAPSHFGGKLLSYRVQPDGETAGRYIFRFRFTEAHRGVKAGRDGWGMEKKLAFRPPADQRAPCSQGAAQHGFQRQLDARVC